MPNLFDYLEWRGDLTFDQVPLGPVDALVLTTMSYVHFRDILPEGPDHPVPLEEAAMAFLALPKEEREKRVRSRMDEELLIKLLECPRFSSLRLSCHVDRLDEEAELQFAAMAVDLGVHGTFVAFRGTDNSLVGWKEDFNMSFQDAIPAQGMARDYLEQCAQWIQGDLILGGHSKGGNLAVYAASMCSPRVRNRVKVVFSHDSPGFNDRIMNSEGYLELLSRIYSFVPQSSVVGMLLEHREPYSVVKSKHIGVFQHDPYTWTVRRGDFIRLHDITEGSRMLNQTVKNWAAGMTNEERCEIVDTVYDLLQTTQADRVQELLQPKNIYSILKAVRKEDDESRHMVAEALGQLAKSALQTLKDQKLSEGK